MQYLPPGTEIYPHRTVRFLDGTRCESNDAPYVVLSPTLVSFVGRGWIVRSLAYKVFSAVFRVAGVPVVVRLLNYPDSPRRTIVAGTFDVELLLKM